MSWVTDKRDTRCFIVFISSYLICKWKSLCADLEGYGGGGGGVGKGATWRFAPINDSHQDQLSLKTFCARTFRAEFNLIIWGIKNYSLSIHVCGYQIQSGVINSNKSRSFISERHWEMLKFYNNDMLRFFNIQC